MRLVLALDPNPIEFTEANSGGAYPYLGKTGDLRLCARAGEAIGIESTESSSMTVTLKPGAAQFARRALRCWAYVYDDADALLFAGIVSNVDYLPSLSIEIGA